MNGYRELMFYSVSFYDDRKNLDKELREKYAENFLGSNPFGPEKFYEINNSIVISNISANKKTTAILKDEAGDVRSELEDKLKCTLTQINFNEQNANKKL